MKQWIKLLIVLLLLTGLLLPSRVSRSVQAVECTDEEPSADLNEEGKAKYWQEVKDACQDNIKETTQQKNTLQAAINVINSKVTYALAQIRQTESQIEDLGKEITTLSQIVNDLSASQEELSQVYYAKVRQLYKNRRPETTSLFLSSDSFASFFSKIKYYQTTRDRDRAIIHEIEKFRLDYDQQKQLKENKQQELEQLEVNLIAQKQDLDNQKQAKNILLTETKNSEAVYQTILTKALAELKAIESIIAGQGSETEVRDISVGEKIASIIPSASACSSGAHLHLEIAKNKIHQNPAVFLKDVPVNWNLCGWWGCDSPFAFIGSWDWPITQPIRITQGYGTTGYAKTGAYGGSDHTGIDMIGGFEVRAMRKGKLYRGSIACGGGTLKYVHVKHSEDEYDSYYLHVDYF